TLTLKTDHPGYYQWTLALLCLPEPEAFRAAGAGLPLSQNAPRVRARDLMRAEDLPPASDAVRARFTPAGWSSDFWNDPGISHHVAARLFAGERTAFESRFVRKRRPIYFVELRKR